MTPELIDRHMAINVRGSLLLLRAFAEHLSDASRSGRIVIFTSGPPQNGAIAYAASKGALEWITFSAATELGPRGITVNAVNPGPNQTGWMTTRSNGGGNDELRWDGQDARKMPLHWCHSSSLRTLPSSTAK